MDFVSKVIVGGIVFLTVCAAVLFGVWYSLPFTHAGSSTALFYAFFAFVWAIVFWGFLAAWQDYIK